jgi:uncharacterized protein involved in response to NO
MKNKIEPYQPFFFSGLLISILGMGVWLLFQLKLWPFYPLQEHGFLMIMGFLLAYITGFLMTAVPKMSQTESAQKWEVGGALGLLWLQVILALSGQMQIGYFVGAGLLFFLFVFVGRRFLSRKANPPMGFIFLPFSFLAALIGCLILATASHWPVEGVQLGKALLYQGFILNLILGLGTRLVPALTRVQGALDVRSQNRESRSQFLGLAVLLNSTFVIEVYASFTMALLIRAAIVLGIAVWKFKILRPRQVAGSLSSGIRLAVWLLAAGFGLAGLFPSYGIHFLHISFIGGFALLTFLISTRVVLSHGGYDLKAEIKSPVLIWFFSLAVFIAALRVLFAFEGSIRTELIAVMCFGWVIWVTLWSRSFLWKLWKVNK